MMLVSRRTVSSRRRWSILVLHTASSAQQAPLIFRDAAAHGRHADTTTFAAHWHSRRMGDDFASGRARWGMHFFFAVTYTPLYSNYMAIPCHTSLYDIRLRSKIAERNADAMSEMIAFDYYIIIEWCYAFHYNTTVSVQAMSAAAHKVFIYRRSIHMPRMPHTSFAGQRINAFINSGDIRWPLWAFSCRRWTTMPRLPRHLRLRWPSPLSTRMQSDALRRK